MKSLRAAALIAALGAGCAQQGEWRNPGASAAQLEADTQHCVALMYSVRRTRGAPDWSVLDYCMEQRGYRRSNRPA